MINPPGLTRTEDEQAALAAALAAKPKGYVPRTHLKDGDAPRYTNRLIHEPSPYLAQHAHNPVDWWPWGDAALAEAKRRGLPIFLSAGYATCHWCHVMEEESFDNEEVAAALNAHFIPVKLDREQRPDIDQYYILATTLQHRHAGWPNSIWATPDGKPFHTGTYFRRPHFLQILGAIANAWADVGKRAEFESFSKELGAAVERSLAAQDPPKALDGAAETAIDYLEQSFNPDHGGFSTGQQFPNEGHLLFLIDQAERNGDTKALSIATKTLDEIAAGGLHDHLGGGFHRYTVDVNWRTPHFEKMLYNQALLMQSFTRAYALTGAEHYARAVARCVDYLKRDMTDASGAFFAAEDADSLNPAGILEEGAFYAWQPEDGPKHLTTADAATLGFNEPPSFEAGLVIHLAPDAQPDFAGLDPVLEELRAIRDARPRPFRDEKLITGWNGLMIRALAEAAVLFDQPDWAKLAETAALAILAPWENGKPLQRILANAASVEDANLSDFIWIAQACVALADATDNPQWLDRATKLAETSLAHFKTDAGRLALTRSGPLGDILEIEDGATPSGESSAVTLFNDLAHRTDDPKWQSATLELRNTLSGRLAQMPIARLTALQGFEAMQHGPSGITRSFHANAITIRQQRQGGDCSLHLTLADEYHLEEGSLRLNEAVLIPKTGTNGEIVVELPQKPGKYELHFQICDRHHCFAPMSAPYYRA